MPTGRVIKGGHQGGAGMTARKYKYSSQRDLTEGLEHHHVFIESRIGSCKQFVASEDGVGASEEHHGLLKWREGHAARGEPNHGLWHDDARSGDSACHLKDIRSSAALPTG
eukprot:scaffold217059_cov33-Tisochrysis_lutea.AAC.3